MTTPSPRRRRARVAIERMVATRPLNGLVARGLRDQASVVYYHAVGPPRPFLEGIVTPRSLDDFDRDLRFLRRSFEIVPLADLLSWNLRSGPRARRPLLAIGFDDGFDLIRSGAADVLDDHRVSATTFVVARCMDNRALMWRNTIASVLALARPGRVVEAYNRVTEGRGLPAVRRSSEVLAASSLWPPDTKDELAARLWEGCHLEPVGDFLSRHRPYFSSSALREWQRRGHSIGLHTATHPHCDRLPPDHVVDEIETPASQLRSAFGLDGVALAYPFGARLEPAVAEQLVRDGVISCALGSGGLSRRRTPPHLLERCEVDRGVGLPLMRRAL